MGSAELPVEEAIAAAVRAKELDIRDSQVTEGLKTFSALKQPSSVLLLMD
jgi:hypothetical protein